MRIGGRQGNERIVNRREGENNENDKRRNREGDKMEERRGVEQRERWRQGREGGEDRVEKGEEETGWRRRGSEVSQLERRSTKAGINRPTPPHQPPPSPNTHTQT